MIHLRRAAAPAPWEAGVDVAAPLLDAAEITLLAAQAQHLARTPCRRPVQTARAGDTPSAWLGRGLDFEESRPYAAGDDVRGMDWRTSARLNRPYVKTWREERQPLLHLVLDRGPAMRFGTRRRLKAAQAVRAATLAAFAAAARQHAVGASLWDSPDGSIPARLGRGPALMLAQRMAAPCPPPGADDSTTAAPARLSRLAAQLPRGARLLLLSDFSWLNEACLPPLGQLAARASLSALWISDPVEHQLPNIGLARFQETPGGRIRWLDTTGSAARADCAARLDAGRARRHALLRRAGVTWFELSTTDDDLGALLHGRC
jgi:uncharacterized protein (DUF58 family)